MLIKKSKHNSDYLTLFPRSSLSNTFSSINISIYFTVRPTTYISTMHVAVGRGQASTGNIDSNTYVSNTSAGYDSQGTISSEVINSGSWSDIVAQFFVFGKSTVPNDNTTVKFSYNITITVNLPVELIDKDSLVAVDCGLQYIKY